MDTISDLEKMMKDYEKKFFIDKQNENFFLIAATVTFEYGWANMRVEHEDAMDNDGANDPDEDRLIHYRQHLFDIAIAKFEKETEMEMTPIKIEEFKDFFDQTYYAIVDS